MLGFKERSVEDRQGRDLRVVLELIGESSGCAIVLWLQDGLCNARIGVSQEGPVQPSTKARRNLRDSCEQPAQMVVWSMMVWLVGEQASQDHLATHLARSVLRRE